MAEIMPGSHWITEEGPFVKTREQEIDISEGAICPFFYILYWDIADY